MAIVLDADGKPRVDNEGKPFDCTGATCPPCDPPAGRCCFHDAPYLDYIHVEIAGMSDGPCTACPGSISADLLRDSLGEDPFGCDSGNPQAAQSAFLGVVEETADCSSEGGSDTTIAIIVNLQDTQNVDGNCYLVGAVIFGTDGPIVHFGTYTGPPTDDPWPVTLNWINGSACGLGSGSTMVLTKP